MKWTDAQKEVIDTRNKNILVSAAAGSGKTAVLTERILRLVLDEENPMDIDKMVVVTFTNAAAGEMRERIMKALQTKAEEYAAARDVARYEYLQKQLTYLHNAKITTIDSFCMDVLRENFSMIDLDPVFRIGEDGELKLLKADVMAELLENKYQQEDEAFLDFVDVYSSHRSDQKIEELVLIMYEFAMSYPYPEEWISQCMEHCEGDGDTFEHTKWYEAMKQLVDAQIELVLEDVNQCLEMTREEDGPWAYQDAILSDLMLVEQLHQAKNYEDRQKIFATYKFASLSRKKQEGIDESKKADVKAIRDDYKGVIKNIGEKYYEKSAKEVLWEMQMVSVHVRVLAELTLDFIKLYRSAKREKNLVDFHDVEHFALEILIHRDDKGDYYPSPVAQRMAEEIGEVMIDEYQDSNYVQEYILQSVSGGHGRNNRFMVGDVKQSIYKFRMAKPELFLEKYYAYGKEETDNDKRIILSQNFRSRKTVLQVANQLFEKIMVKELGGIQYDADNALNYGASYESEDAPAEILIADMSEIDTKEEALDGKEMEAEMVAIRINELIKEKYQVTDKETGKLRDMTYGDVVILMRSLGEYAKCYERVLQSKGIPVKCPVKKNTLEAFEVSNVLEFLKIIDNPRQDIPLVAVLKNMFHFAEEEIALIKILGQKRFMYDNIREVLEAECDTYESQNLKNKVSEFWKLLQKYRKEKVYLSIYDLINRIVEETGFEYFVSALPDGVSRLANLAMLKEKASVYQQGSYSGLFHFVRYIEKNQQYQVEQEIILNAQEAQAVTLMSIHKSKGLEFPVVILAGIGKRFNQEDASKEIILHQNYGIGMDMYDSSRNIKSRTLMKRSLSGQIVMENIAEELRVLYVAMTRAKEKLILAGNGKMQNKWDKYHRLAKNVRRKGRFYLNELLGAGNYMDFVLMSLMKDENRWDETGDGYVIKVYDGESLTKTLMEEKHLEMVNKDVLEHWDCNYIYDKECHDAIENNLAFSYKYAMDTVLKAKVSISEIKHRYMRLEDGVEESAELIGFEEEERKPEFLSENKETGESSATVRGTVYHRVFQLLDYDREYETEDDVLGFLCELVERRLLDEESKNVVRCKDILKFYHSELGERMKKAYKNGVLWREQPFVMNIPAREVEEGYDGDETQLVQGIMDAYFEEDGGMCVVDYKTDAVQRLEELDKRYHAQLKYYGEAVKRIAGKPLKDCIIYSVKFGRELKISTDC